MTLSLISWEEEAPWRRTEVDSLLRDGSFWFVVFRAALVGWCEGGEESTVK